MADASCAIVNGAVSLVNAIAARKGATLGVKLVTEAIVKKSEGNGIIVNTPKNSPGDKLVAMTVEKSISKAQLRSHKITHVITGTCIIVCPRYAHSGLYGCINAGAYYLCIIYLF